MPTPAESEATMSSCYDLGVMTPVTPEPSCTRACLSAPKNLIVYMRNMSPQEYMDKLVIIAQTVIDLANGPLGELIVKLLTGL